jgi:hypothetical protein
MRGRTFLGYIAAALTAAAAADQFRRPPEQRTWTGRVAGVPYDFRPPTVERALAKVWDPENPSLIAPTVWGVGWTINFYRLVHPLSS